MGAIHRGDVGAALAAIDAGHAELAAERAHVARVNAAFATAATDPAPVGTAVVDTLRRTGDPARAQAELARRDEALQRQSLSLSRLEGLLSTAKLWSPLVAKLMSPPLGVDQ
ncbi:hypothetical protein ACFPFQ_43465, partial [Pseudonocardia sp. GCM10023141]